MGLSFILLILFFAVTVHSNSCPERYLRFSQDHTFCKPKNHFCDIIMKGVSDSESQEILEIHNDLRSRVATGTASMPTAANMLEMVWDPELAAIAQKHAETCFFGNDCSKCRMTPSFEVGQIIKMQSVSGMHPKKSDWKWFVEGRNMQQIIWADTWAVGCGFAMYKDGKWIRSYYVCNYGPAGNIAGRAAYEQGPICSKCPENTCCGSSCRTYQIVPKYAGLCKIMDATKPPGEGREVDDIFFCNFQGQEDCQVYITSPVTWHIFSTKAGNYAAVTLSGGQDTTLKFANSIKADSGELCFSLYYRRMPSLAGDEFANSGLIIFDTGSSYPMKFKFASLPESFWHAFLRGRYSLTIPKNRNVDVTLTFSVPPGKPRQTLEVKSVSAKRGRCK